MMRTLILESWRCGVGRGWCREMGMYKYLDILTVQRDKKPALVRWVWALMEGAWVGESTLT